VDTTLARAPTIIFAVEAVAVAKDHLSNFLHPGTPPLSDQHVKYATNKATQQPHAGSGMSRATRMTSPQCMSTWPQQLLLLTPPGIRILAPIHLTNDLSNLNLNAAEYTGLDTIRVGNDQGLKILHSSRGILPTPSHNFHLYSLFHVP
jgi:hypothetical protein